MILTFEPIEIMTRPRLSAVRRLLDILEHAIPEHGARLRAEFGDRAQALRMDDAEFSSERDILEDEIGNWLPRFGAYAVVILLFTILEVHLFECAKRARERMELPSRPEDIPGPGILRLATDLKNSGVHDIKRDDAWATLNDLRKLRNLIAHRAGTRIAPSVAAQLARKYEGGLDYQGDGEDWFNQVWISIGLCRQFADTLEGFLARTLEKVNALAPPERGTVNEAVITKS